MGATRPPKLQASGLRRRSRWGFCRRRQKWFEFRACAVARSEQRQPGRDSFSSIRSLSRSCCGSKIWLHVQVTRTCTFSGKDDRKQSSLRFPSLYRAARDGWLHFLSPSVKSSVWATCWPLSLQMMGEHEESCLVTCQGGKVIAFCTSTERRMSKAGNNKGLQANWIWVMTHPVRADRDVKWALGILPDCGELTQDRVVKTKASLFSFIMLAVCSRVKFFFLCVRCVSRCNDKLVSGATSPWLQLQPACWCFLNNCSGWTGFYHLQ